MLHCQSQSPGDANKFQSAGVRREAEFGGAQDRGVKPNRPAQIKKTRLSRASSVRDFSFRGSQIVILGEFLDEIPGQGFKLPQAVIDDHATNSFHDHGHDIGRIA